MAGENLRVLLIGSTGVVGEHVLRLALAEPGFDEVVAPTRLSFTFTFVDSNDRPTVNAMMPEWPVGAHIVMTVELVATARGTRMTVAQRVAEPELADSAPIVRHRKLAAIGWSQTAPRLVAYLERRTPWDS